MCRELFVDRPRSRMAAFIRSLMPTWMPPLKSMLVPVAFIFAMFPHMDSSAWAKTTTWMLMAMWIGSLLTEKIENSEWRKKLREEADRMSTKGEREAEDKMARAATTGGSTKKKKS